MTLLSWQFGPSILSFHTWLLGNLPVPHPFGSAVSHIKITCRHMVPSHFDRNFYSAYPFSSGVELALCGRALGMQIHSNLLKQWPKSQKRQLAFCEAIFKYRIAPLNVLCSVIMWLVVSTALAFFLPHSHSSRNPKSGFACGSGMYQFLTIYQLVTSPVWRAVVLSYRTWPRIVYIRIHEHLEYGSCNIYWYYEWQISTICFNKGIL